MAFKPAICTQCGGKLDVDDSKDAGICPYCGTAFVTEKVISQYVINVQDGVDTDNLYILARRAAATDNAADAVKYYEMLKLRNPNDWEATFYSAWFKKDASLAQTIAVALDLLDSSDDGSRKEHYAEIADKVTSGLDGNELAELSCGLLDKNKPEQAELLMRVLTVQLNKSSYETYESLFETLQKAVKKKDPAYKEFIERALVPLVNHCAPESKSLVEDVIWSCDFIDQNKWIDILHGHVREHINEESKANFKGCLSILVWLIPVVLMLILLLTATILGIPGVAFVIGIPMILIYFAVVGIIKWLSNLSS